MGNNESVESQPLGDVVGQDDIIEEVITIIANNSVEESKEKIKGILLRWEQFPVNVCVLGERGSGKSSFINNMAGEILAKTGQAETTIEARSYPHPANEKLKFWDLPGFGALQLMLTSRRCRWYVSTSFCFCIKTLSCRMIPSYTTKLRKLVNPVFL